MHAESSSPTAAPTASNGHDAAVVRLSLCFALSFLSLPVPLPCRHMIYSSSHAHSAFSPIPTRKRRRRRRKRGRRSCFDVSTQHPALSCFLLHSVPPSSVPVTQHPSLHGQKPHTMNDPPVIETPPPVLDPTRHHRSCTVET